MLRGVFLCCWLGARLGYSRFRLNRVEAFEMCSRRILRTLCTAHITSKEVLQEFQKEPELLKMVLFSRG